MPPDLDYMQVTALSFEARQTLNKHRPQTLGLASRISGITPATVSLLLVYLKKSGFRGLSAPEMGRQNAGPHQLASGEVKGEAA